MPYVFFLDLCQSGTSFVTLREEQIPTAFDDRAPERIFEIIQNELAHGESCQVRVNIDFTQHFVPVMEVKVSPYSRPLRPRG